MQSIVKAHNNLKKGSIFASSGELLDASVNRSPSAYEKNPEEERSKYEHDTDKTTTLLRFVDVHGKDLGMINWFATHGTSMPNTNLLISGDNKGYASQLFEQKMNSDALPGKVISRDYLPIY
ncbi:hypothetical protein Avbf_04129 [Armadillidium vulgare]|nr:hypothetical protein Avbf_04129 [Armadillidium vulgare]